MNRGRGVLAAALAVLATIGGSGCSADGGRSSAPGTAASATAAPATRAQPSASTGCPAPAIGAVAPGSSLTPGPTNGLTASPARGEALVVTAVVLDPNCRPASGATVSVWHTDARGVYGPATETCCYFGGTVQTDANGRFRLDTIRPAQYPVPGAPPAHIHLEIRHQAGGLNTEISFSTAAGAQTVLLPSDNVPVALRPAGSGSWACEAGFVLER